MTIWPATLSQDVFAGYREQLPDVRLRTEMETGVAKQRRRFTAAPRIFTVTVPLERSIATPAADQVKIFRAFFDDTIAGGSLPFDWVDPLDESAITFRYAGDRAPEIVHVAGNEYRVELTLEVLP